MNLVGHFFGRPIELCNIQPPVKTRWTFPLRLTKVYRVPGRYLLNESCVGHVRGRQCAEDIPGRPHLRLCGQQAGQHPSLRAQGEYISTYLQPHTVFPERDLRCSTYWKKCGEGEYNWLTTRDSLAFPRPVFTEKIIKSFFHSLKDHEISVCDIFKSWHQPWLFASSCFF